MKIIISEKQYQKIKNILSENNDIDEISISITKEPKLSGDFKKKYSEIKNTNSKLKTINNFSIFYDMNDEYDSTTITFNILDDEKKEFVGYVGFDILYGNEFKVNYPLIRPEYRGKGLTSEIYKTVLNGGNLVSGSEQTPSAIGLWKKLYKEFPNMKFIDANGKKHDVELKNNEFVTKDGIKVHDENQKEKSFLMIPKK